MNDPETMAMVLSMEHERLVAASIAEGHARRALAQQPARVERATAVRALELARRLVAGARQRFRQWLPLPWDEPAPRVAIATASDI